jgi:hypothetical protein
LVIFFFGIKNHNAASCAHVEDEWRTERSEGRSRKEKARRGG